MEEEEEEEEKAGCASRGRGSGLVAEEKPMQWTDGERTRGKKRDREKV